MPVSASTVPVNRPDEHLRIQTEDNSGPSVGEQVAVAVQLYIIGQLAFLDPVHSGLAVAVWLPAGWASVALARFGWGVAPALIAALGSVFYSLELALPVSVALAVATLLQASLDAGLVRAAQGLPWQTGHVGHAAVGLLFVGLFTPALAGTLQAAILCAAGECGWTWYTSLAIHWSLANSVGSLLLLPLLLQWTAGSRTLQTNASFGETAAFLISVMAWVRWTLLQDPAPDQAALRLVSAVPVLAWGVWRLGAGATFAALLVICQFSLWGAQDAIEFTSDGPSPRLPILQIACATLASMTILALTINARRVKAPAQSPPTPA